MLKRRADRLAVTRENMRGGQGPVTMFHLLDGDEEMYRKGRLFAHFILEPGCSIGYHVHEGESETYYILKGTGEYSDNVMVTTVHAGDVTFTADGEGHSIKNIGEEPLEFIALILYK